MVWIKAFSIPALSQKKNVFFLHPQSIDLNYPETIVKPVVQYNK